MGGRLAELVRSFPDLGILEMKSLPSAVPNEIMDAAMDLMPRASFPWVGSSGCDLEVPQRYFWYTGFSRGCHRHADRLGPQAIRKDSTLGSLHAMST